MSDARRAVSLYERELGRDLMATEFLVFAPELAGLKAWPMPAAWPDAVRESATEAARRWMAGHPERALRAISSWVDESEADKPVCILVLHHGPAAPSQAAAEQAGGGVAAPAAAGPLLQARSA